MCDRVFIHFKDISFKLKLYVNYDIISYAIVAIRKNGKYFISKIIIKEKNYGKTGRNNCNSENNWY